jgi:hypothetical protein
MARKHPVKEINLKIIDVSCNQNELGTQYLRIEWASDIGFGEYEFYKTKDSDQWKIDSEYMDRGDDKEFGQELLRLWLESCIVSQ